MGRCGTHGRADCPALRTHDGLGAYIVAGQEPYWFADLAQHCCVPAIAGSAPEPPNWRSRRPTRPHDGFKKIVDDLAADT